MVRNRSGFLYSWQMAKESWRSCCIYQVPPLWLEGKMTHPTWPISWPASSWPKWSCNPWYKSALSFVWLLATQVRLHWYPWSDFEALFEVGAHVAYRHTKEAGWLFWSKVDCHWHFAKEYPNASPLLHVKIKEHNEEEDRKDVDCWFNAGHHLGNVQQYHSEFWHSNWNHFQEQWQLSHQQWKDCIVLH